MPMVIEFTRIAAVKVHSFYYNILNFNFAVVFVCIVQCLTKTFFRSNKSPNLKTVVKVIVTFFKPRPKRREIAF